MESIGIGAWLFLIAFIAFYVLVMVIVPYFVFIRPAKLKWRGAVVGIYGSYLLLPALPGVNFGDSLLVWVAISGFISWTIGMLLDRRKAGNHNA